MLAEFLFHFGMEPTSLISSLRECLDCLSVVQSKYKYRNLGHKLILAFEIMRQKLKNSSVLSLYLSHLSGHRRTMFFKVLALLRVKIFLVQFKQA